MIHISKILSFLCLYCKYTSKCVLDRCILLKVGVCCFYNDGYTHRYIRRFRLLYTWPSPLKISPIFVTAFFHITDIVWIDNKIHVTLPILWRITVTFLKMRIDRINLEMKRITLHNANFLKVGEISGEFGDNVSMSSRGGRISIAPDNVENVAPELPPEEEPPFTFSDYFKIMKATHMKALIWKNFLWMWRNAPVMAFIIGLPVAQSILFCLSIGHDPTGLKISVVNRELDFPQENICKPSLGCNSTRLSCNYIKFLENRTLIPVRVDAKKYLHFCCYQ